MSNKQKNRLAAFASEYARAGEETPFFVLNPEIVAENYRTFVRCIDNSFSENHRTQIFYAVKAQSHPKVLDILCEAGSSFDAASLGEIKMTKDVDRFLNVRERVSFGNTVKKTKDIAAALGLGVRLFVVDCIEEVTKLGQVVRQVLPVSQQADVQVYVRIATSGINADWALSNKFGCDTVETACAILSYVHATGMKAVGVSFHVGSNQRDPKAWLEPLEKTKLIFDILESQGILLDLINLGGGFPAFETEDDLMVYTKQIGLDLIDVFGYSRNLRIMLEPGRALAANAGIVATSVVLNSKTRTEQPWLYLDAGVFSGFVETLDEAIVYPIVDELPLDILVRNYCVAGMTCDSADVLYEKKKRELPVDLKEGDVLYFMNAGCYFTSYSTGNHEKRILGFNGFPAPRIIVI